MDHVIDEGPPPLQDAQQGAIPLGMDDTELLALPFGGVGTTDGSYSYSNRPGNDAADQDFVAAGSSTKPPLPPARDRVPLPTRPALKRDKSIPPTPQHLPPPAPPAPPTDMGTPTDSISLMQLRRLVNEMPKAEPTLYAFEYKDASSFPEELEEWFTYAIEEQAMILKTQSSFVHKWVSFNCKSSVSTKGKAPVDTSYEDGMLDWTKSEGSKRRSFIQTLLSELQQPDDDSRLKCLEALTCIVLGCWYETAGLKMPSDTPSKPDDKAAESDDNEGTSSYVNSTSQLEWIKSSVREIVECGGLQQIYDVMRPCCHRACNADLAAPDMAPEKQESDKRELFCSMTIMYVCLETARANMEEGLSQEIRSRVGELNPDLLLTLMEYICRIRWDETVPLPLAKILLLMWKAILVRFGGLHEVEAAKASFKDPSLVESDKHGQPLITASPLDYHLFRQEISSKYPAYNPPPPLFPLEPENNSILPPLKNHPSKAAGSHVYGSGLNGNATSILHQPVHIATPAPSPPPSPGGPGGKGGKKQNYQTNQLFPFLYPPLDESSNNLGGKGTTDLQDVLVGRKWEGSDIPTSILEAAELFAKRMRATRAMKQLWEVRVQFMKYERGWTNPDDDVNTLNLNDKEKLLALDIDGSKEVSEDAKEESDLPRSEVPQDKPKFGSVEERLAAVESFYANALPQLQSLVIVLIRVILNHVTTIVTQANGPNGLQSGFQFQDTQNGTTANKPETNGTGITGQGDSASTAEELDAMRSQEILDKALSGILILLLKWFKVSHILKFEYMTQLLLDSSYIPLVLKLLQLQEIERVVAYKCDREDMNFFKFCLAHSRTGLQERMKRPSSPAASEKGFSSDEDDAVPPPIKRHRDSPPPAGPEQAPNTVLTQPPEVDELGFPTSDLPAEPITTFSWRAFFTSINYLRILQKICKGKAHRNLMLVSYKSSQVLRKCLRVPQPSLRVYTLKLFKNQVPYCGRKWRQTNMRVITAVYLHCRPELRDEWLSGSDVDAEVDESVPLEQALRALTHWWNLKWYPEAMGAQEGVLEEERDFFRRELEKMSWGDESQGEADLMGGSDGQWEPAPEGW